jgi:glycerophosphoryl diester phosphodiesterase
MIDSKLQNLKRLEKCIMRQVGMYKIIAHRGASTEAPENTLSSIRAALEYGVDYVEIDIRLTKDNIPVIMHDKSLSRTTGRTHTRLLHNLTWDQIKHLDVGSWFDPHYSRESIPSLESVLNEGWGSSGLMLEIKECVQHPEIVVSSIFSRLSNAEKLPMNLILGSFSLQIVEEIIKQIDLLHIDADIIGIVEEAENLQLFIDRNVKRLAIWDELISETTMRLLLRKGVEVWVFTVDDVMRAKKLFSMGVAGIITNHPAKFA